MRLIILVASFALVGAARASDCAPIVRITQGLTSNFAQETLVKAEYGMQTLGIPILDANRCWARPSVADWMGRNVDCNWDFKGDFKTNAAETRGDQVFARLMLALKTCRPDLVADDSADEDTYAGEIKSRIRLRNASHTQFWDLTLLRLGLFWSVKLGADLHQKPQLPETDDDEEMEEEEPSVTPSVSSTPAKQQSVTPDFIANISAYADCQKYEKLVSLIKSDFKDAKTGLYGDKESLQPPVAGENFCLIYRKSADAPQASAACVWSKYGAEHETWVKSLYAARVKSLASCRSHLKPVLVLPQGRLNADEQSAFRAIDGTEGWALGYNRVGNSWFLEMEAFVEVTD
jgi:hypothetical protein